jgi:hypothetical protein
MPIAAKDDYRVQQPRIKRLVEELDQGCVAEFKTNDNPKSLEMRVIDLKTGDLLYTSVGFWPYSTLADNSDEGIKNLLRSWGAGKHKGPEPEGSLAL